MMDYTKLTIENGQKGDIEGRIENLKRSIIYEFC
jgi:hypothetical protein